MYYMYATIIDNWSSRRHEHGFHDEHLRHFSHPRASMSANLYTKRDKEENSFHQFNKDAATFDNGISCVYVFVFPNYLTQGQMNILLCLLGNPQLLFLSFFKTPNNHWIKDMLDLSG